MQITNCDTILGFLENSIPDYKDRYHQEILNFTDAELEKCHDQVQWMFPLHEASNFAEVYPILTPPVVAACRASFVVKRSMQLAATRMEKFYRLGLNNSTIHWIWTANKHDRPNHNLLRITRIIRSLRFMGLEDEAKQFHDSAAKIAKQHGLGDKTFEYWSKALNDNVWESLR